MNVSTTFSGLGIPKGHSQFVAFGLWNIGWNNFVKSSKHGLRA